MAKIYTRTGDKGKTGLVDGSRVSKSDLRIVALGDLDEANAAIGSVVSWIAKEHPLRPLLIQAQQTLFNCGARLADPGELNTVGVPLPSHTLIRQYEQSIDAMTSELPPLTQFILPGGVEAAARTHLARASIRRAERSITALKDSGEHVDATILQFLNRQADWLFTLARYFNAKAGEDEIVWSSEV